jgi:hypothetical protein
MTYTDAQGRPELVMDPDIARGTAAYRVMASPGDGTGTQQDTPRPRRDLSPVRAAAAAAARAEAPTDS